MRVTNTITILAAATAFMLSACSSSGSDSAVPGTPQSSQFTGVALPTGYSLDGDRSLALGVGDHWMGRLSFTNGMSIDEAFDFYRREMPKFGWAGGAVVRSETSLLTFTSPSTNRVAVVQITGRTFGGSRVEMVVSPMTGSDSGSTAVSTPAPYATPAPAPSPGSVSVQPLR